MAVPWSNPPNAGAAPDCLQRPLLRRSRFRQQVSASVRLQKRRAVCGAALSGSSSTAQPPDKVVRVGWLYFGFASSPYLDGLRQGLHELGYVEGQNLALEQRHAEGHYERLPDLAADLVRLR